MIKARKKLIDPYLWYWKIINGNVNSKTRQGNIAIAVFIVVK